jgi:hypothetical protein
LLPRGPWLGFLPHALGRSDRSAALEPARDIIERVLSFAKSSSYSDRATLAALSEQAIEQIRLCLRLGDRDSARILLDELTQIDETRPELSPLTRTLNEPRRSHPGANLLENAGTKLARIQGPR